MSVYTNRGDVKDETITPTACGSIRRNDSGRSSRHRVPHDTEFLTVDCNGFIQAHGSLPWMEVTFWEGNDELGVVGVVTEEEGADWMYRRDPVFVGADGYAI